MPLWAVLPYMVVLLVVYLVVAMVMLVLVTLKGVWLAVNWVVAKGFRLIVDGEIHDLHTIRGSDKELPPLV